jgi:hypothetical protein
VAFAVEGDGVGFATESYAASALYTTLANLSADLWRIRWASGCSGCGVPFRSAGFESFGRRPTALHFPCYDGNPKG